VQIRDYADDTRDQFKWKWNRGQSTTIADFKDPANGSATYGVCVYDASANPQPLMEANVPPDGTCGARPCWKATATGFFYRNKAGTPDGITSLKLRAGITGKARVQVKGRGANLDTPALPLTLPVTVQLVIRDEVSTECWQTTFSLAGRNDASRFIAKGP
jgi:hypothetical protein